MSRRPCVGTILAGGLATRFGGGAKGLERVDGVRIIDAIASTLAEVVDELRIVSNAEDASRWLPGVRAVPDVYPGIGSLGGLHAALAHAGGRDVLVVAWDMPFVPASLLRVLRTRGAGGEIDAAIPRTAATPDANTRGGHADDVRAEPLCAWYAAGCAMTAERLVRAGERRALALGEALNTAWIDPTPFGDPARLFMNVNTPDELARARDAATPAR